MSNTNDQDWEALLNSETTENLAGGLDVIARVLATFFASLTAQGLPQPLVFALVTEMYRHMLSAMKR